jgi:hypothetical protein
MESIADRYRNWRAAAGVLPSPPPRQSGTLGDRKEMFTAGTHAIALRPFGSSSTSRRRLRL